ncbi:MAG: hypothetical protein AABZ39_08535 [Spirochaetota bacterium]
MLFGELLVSKHIVTETQMQMLLEKARARNMMIGELCVAENIITREELIEFLKEQGYLRDGETKK